MATITISKIQVRRGLESSLPGAPESLFPLEFSDGLDEGELGFATDTGRLFIGHDPDSGNPNFERTVFPYQNIEVLTENSGDALKIIHDNLHKQMDYGSFFNTTLIETTSWETVEVSGADFGFADADFVSMEIEYFASFENDSPIRQGKLNIIYDGTAAEPLLEDISTALVPLDTTILDGALDSVEVMGRLQFKAFINDVSGNKTLYIQYINNTGEPLTFNFRITRIN